MNSAEKHSLHGNEKEKKYFCGLFLIVLGEQLISEPLETCGRKETWATQVN